MAFGLLKGGVRKYENEIDDHSDQPATNFETLKTTIYWPSPTFETQETALYWPSPTFVIGTN